MARSETHCTFCDIASGTATADVVFENEQVIAFLDTRPVFKGHCLLIPREHWPTLQELPAGLVEPVFLSAQRLSEAVRQGLNVDGAFIAINNGVSQSVPHLHVHVIPRSVGDGLRGFFWPRVRYDSPEERTTIAAAIRGAW